VTAILSEADIGAWDEAVDVLIAGGGCAGACAALGAAAEGAEVMLLERGMEIGGTSALSGGVIYCGGGTAVQRACGFEDSVDAMRGYLIASTGCGPDVAKVDRYCEDSVGHFNWLVGLGVPFKDSYWPYNYEPTTDDCLYYSGSEFSPPYCDLARPAPRGHTVQAWGSCKGGGKLMSVLAPHVARAAKLVTEARIRALIRASDGRIVGATFLRDDKTYAVRARAGLVVATGGFVMNREMIGRYAPQALPLKMLGNPYDDGSGILLGAAAGAATINMGAVMYPCPILSPSGLIRGILMNAKGQRFVDESSNHKRIGESSVLAQGGKIYLLVDSQIYEDPAMGLPIVASGETARELEDELGWTPGSIGATLDLYNRYAREGRDPLFGKGREHLVPLDHPPYAVFDCSVEATGVYLTMTLGGLMTRVTGEVMTPEGEVLPGLYAAGRATSCLSAQSCGSSGLQVGEGTFFGRLAGQAAARAGAA
jgi:succinate dehydrogenase/fumarate reductase flavoprotein subunit